jgi:hypothetical protein
MLGDVSSLYDSFGEWGDFADTFDSPGQIGDLLKEMGSALGGGALICLLFFGVAFILTLVSIGIAASGCYKACRPDMKEVSRTRTALIVLAIGLLLSNAVIMIFDAMINAQIQEVYQAFGLSGLTVTIIAPTVFTWILIALALLTIITQAILSKMNLIK